MTLKKLYMGKYMLLASACLIILGSCLNEPEFSEIPEIAFLGMTQNVFTQSFSPTDSTRVTISFQDGDGDIGGDSLAIFVTDTRTDNLESEFRILEIPIEGVSNAISGEISFPIFTTCCIFDDGSGRVPCTPTNNPVLEEELVYEIFIKDRAGNESNKILIDPILLRCE